ncbi:hypothetical protein FACS189496_3210 [Bacilli bacterium]|nr:hypothetical protein FACS189496_3210 [Bacilli bacterium]
MLDWKAVHGKDEKVREKEPWDSSTEKAKTLKMEDFGSPEEVREMAKMPRTAKTYAEAREIVNGIVDKPLSSKSGLKATISRKSIKEMLSGEAVGKSIDLKAHLKATANVDKLYENAIEKWSFELNPSKNNEGLKDRKYLYAPMEYTDAIIPVKLTVKEYKDQAFEKRLYSVEAIDVVIK